MEQINPSEIHLWLADLGELTGSHLLAQYRLLLNEAELQQQMRFHFERDRHRYLVTRAMVRTVLSTYANVMPRAWRFLFNPFGKPSIAGEHVAARGIEFNVSHTDGLVVMGITRERPIGVDVENVRTRVADIEIADSYFAPQEVAALRALSREKQKQRFFEYWTLKESYIKARGAGLAIPLDRFAFHLGDSEVIRLTTDPSLRDQPEHWAFWQLRLTSDHLAAVCTAQFGPEVLSLSPVRSWP